MSGQADAEEMFDLVNDVGEVVGQALRSKCHKEGLLHQAVYCWVFDSDGRLLLQRRSEAKKIGPGQWDLSVAEHLQVGEGFRAGALRGLREELGLSVRDADLEGPLAPTHRRDLRVDGLHDAELVQSYLCRVPAGVTIHLDPGEVAEVAWEHLDSVVARVGERPERFTEWVRAEGSALGWFQSERVAAEPAA